MRKQKSLAKLKQECQIVFNAYIRKRDEGQPCISCGQNKPLQAGHFFSVKMYDGLRFNEDNVHGECASCNCFNDSHLIWYRENLMIKIDTDRYDKLLEDAQNYKKYGYRWSRSEIEGKIKYYKQKIKEL